MRKYKINKSKLINFITLILVMLILVVLILLINSIRKYSYKNNKTVSKNDISEVNVVINNENIINDINENKLKKLQKMGERDRIEYYVSDYIKLLENKDFQKAYNLLNNEFKNNYFSNINLFEKYVNEKFSNLLNVKYTNFERNGAIYVVWLELSDMINGKKDEVYKMNFVVKENDFNDFELSFSVI